MVNDKKLLNRTLVGKKMTKSLRKNYFWVGREWPYKYVKPRIIAEKYLLDNNSSDIKDYKFFTFDGCAKLMFVVSDRQSSDETKFDFYDMEFNHLDIVNGHPNTGGNIIKPDRFDEMKELAEIISRDNHIPHCRVDFYYVDGKIYFGEITFFHWSGFVPFCPQSWDEKMGDWINLPN